MTEIMLCGAHDVENIAPSFYSVVADFGATPWCYLNGKILHKNSVTSSWTENSRATVRQADVCVFVVLQQYGEITWTDELDEALNQGKPFIVLALESAYIRFNVLRREKLDPQSIDTNDKSMIDVFRIMDEYEFTVVSFTYETFKNQLRDLLSAQFKQGLELIKSHNLRKNLMQSLNGKGKLTHPQIKSLKSLASDDYHENKYERKTAIRRLAEEQIRDNNFVLDTCNSTEQGVQRIIYDLLTSLIELPLNDDILRELSHVAINTDDVGVARRLVSSVSGLEPTKLDIIIEGLGKLEEGVRRRAFEGIEGNYSHVLNIWGQARMTQILTLCQAKSTGQMDWTERLRKLLAELSEK